MTTEAISPTPKLKFFDSNGVPLIGGKLFTYEAGTASTKQTTYTDSTGGTANTNPIILDARGECDCWLDPSLLYKFTLSPSSDTDPPTNPIWTVDNIASAASGVTAENIYALTNVAGTNSITADSPPVITTYSDGLTYLLTPATTNTGAATLDVSSLGPKNIYKNNTALVGGELVAGSVSLLTYANNVWNIMGGGGILSKLLNSQLVGPRATYQFLTTSGTYTRPASLTCAVVIGIGGGGAGAGGIATGAGTMSAASGGNSGCWQWGIFTAAQIGATLAYTIGAAGAAAAGANGGDGGDTIWGPSGAPLMTAKGGNGGNVNAALAPPTYSDSYVQSSLGSGGIFGGCNTGTNGYCLGASTYQGGKGGDGLFGQGGVNLIGTTFQGPLGYGAGGAGSCAPESSAAVAGQDGLPGAILVIELY